MILNLALRLCWRDWRAGELTLLLASLVIAVGTVTTITLFVDRLERALVAESATFLAADRVIQTSTAIDQAVLDEARKLGLRQSTTLNFLSMVFAEDRAQFSSVKAVDSAYPLRGQLIAGDAPFQRGAPTTQGPALGELWLESRLYPSLNISLNELVDVGVASFPATRVLIKEPDRGGGFTNAGPRVLMHLEDVTATEVVKPGSRITWRYLFAGTDDQLAAFETWVKPRLAPGSRFFGVKEGTQGIGKALDRAERFLLLGSLLGVVLAGVAIALAARRYSLRHYDHVAILKTLGVTPRRIDLIFLTIFVLLGSLATGLGACIGYLMQWGVTGILAPWIPVNLPAPGIKPLALGLVTGFVCLLAFALPPLLRLRSIAPMRVIRRLIDNTDGSASLQTTTWGMAVAGIIGLMWWYSEDLLLTLMIFSGATVSLTLLAGIAWLLLGSGRLVGMQAGSAWRLALAGMQRRGHENTMQMLVFGLAIMLLLILYLVRVSLISEWQGQIPENAPNHFAINISPTEVADIQQLFQDNQVATQPLYPMIRGRVASVNGEATGRRDDEPDQDDQEDQEGLLEDDDDERPRSGSTRNLTFSASLPDDNIVVAGEWWGEDYSGPPLVSLEKEMAEDNRMVVGDTLVFDIQGRELTARVASIRTVAWDNLQPNFFIIFSPGALVDFPSTFMTSFHLDASQKLFLNELLNKHPTMTVIEVDALIEQIKRIITQVTLAVELVLLLVLASGGLVLLASIQASMDERLRQHAIIRTLGAGRKLVLSSLTVEFCILGVFAGVLAVLGAEVTVYALETQVFELEHSLNPQLWLLGPALGMVLIGLLGVLATRRVVTVPPASVLREL